MRISIRELLKNHLTNPCLAANDPAVCTIRAIGIGGGGDPDDCWVEVKHQDGEAFLDDLSSAAHGNGVTKEHKVMILVCAAMRGHVQSMNDLGWCFRTGNGVKKDLKLAIRWHTQAADRGNTDAMHHLGIFRRRAVGYVAVALGAEERMIGNG